jgi:hypothetical protein
MRHAITSRQTSPEALKTMPDPMRIMQICKGMCDQVPDEVCEAVFDTLNSIPGVYRECSEREALATLVAPRMAREGWRFCPCFSAKRTMQHTRIFDLVHTKHGESARASGCAGAGECGGAAACSLDI